VLPPIPITMYWSLPAEQENAVHPSFSTNISDSSNSSCYERDISVRNSDSKSCPTTRHEGAWGEGRYSSYPFSTSALDGGEWSASRPGRVIAQGKGVPVLIVQEAGWTPEPVWTERLEKKSFCLCRGSNLDRPGVQPVARHYTDWATWRSE
jgi:hypothetical protein